MPTSSASRPRSILEGGGELEEKQVLVPVGTVIEAGPSGQGGANRTAHGLSHGMTHRDNRTRNLISDAIPVTLIVRRWG